MKVCLYARQQCKWPDENCPRRADLRPVFGADPEQAVRKVWGCQWAGSRLTTVSYLMYLVQKKKVKVAGK